MKIIFDRPAGEFPEALPMGNGRLGAMIYGGVLREQVVLNESSMWSGSPENADREDAAEYLPQIRRLLSEGKNYEAQQLFSQHFTCKGKGTNRGHGTVVPFGCYQVLGRLHLSYFQAVSTGRQESCGVEDYRRYLDLETGQVTVSFRLEGKRYRRQWLVSPDGEAVFGHFTVTKESDEKELLPGEVNISCGLDRDERFCTGKLEADFPGLIMSGQLEDGHGTDCGVRYACILTAVTRGGRVEAEEQRLHIRKADEAWVIVTARTDMGGFLGRKSLDARAGAVADARRAAGLDWKSVEKNHRDWYTKQYQSMQLRLGTEEEAAELEKMPIPDRLHRFLDGKEDPGLITLYVQYARYLLISSSQEDSLPANLQGIWADEIQTPWNGDWHLNAQQMIYWLAEKANLSHCHVPYLRLTEALVEPGRKTAKAYYGARGWLAHTCTNPWGFTSPGEDASWGSTTGSPAWQCHHLWEHYLYTRDAKYLKQMYPVMKEAALFYLDMLVENKEGYLVTSPSSSPENSFLDEEGRKCALCEGPAYDRELVLSLVDACIQAQYVLGEDAAFAQQLLELRPRLAPVEIGSDGRIKEWGEEYREAMPFHRHLSHLWGVYPGSLITAEETPDYADAALRSLKGRGRTTAGWAISFRMCLWARLRKGDEAYSCMRDGLRYATAHNLLNLAYHCDETLTEPPVPDIDRCRFPFQIDGNQGNASGILLMLMDDRAVVRPDGGMLVQLTLLPALPAAFPEGSVRGLRAKGGLTVDLDWKEGRLIDARIGGNAGCHVQIHYEGKTEELLPEQKEWSMRAAE